MNFLPAFIHRRIAHRPSLVRIVGNMGWLFLDKVLRMGAGLVVGVWVARYLGPEQFGLLSFSTAFVALFGALAGLGLQGIVVRDIVRDPAGTEATLGTSVGLQLLGGFVAYGSVLGCVSWLRPEDAMARTLVAILGLAMLVRASEVASYWFEAQVKSRYAVWVQNAAFLLFACVKVGLIVTQAPLVAFAWATLGEAVLAALLLFVMLGLRGPALRQLRVSFQRAGTLLKDAWPLLLSSLAVTLCMRVDQLMIGQLLTDSSVGIYAVGVRLAEAFVFLGMAIASSVFPRLVEADDERFEREFVVLVRWPFYTLLLLAVAVSLTSQAAIEVIFGAAYEGSAPVLSLLIFSIPITYLSIMSSKYLLRRGYHREILLRQLAGVVANIVLNSFLIPRYGVVGAALATVITDLVIAIGLDAGRERCRQLLALKLKALFFVGGSTGSKAA